MKVVWTETAERWLRDIHDYIAMDNARAAKSVVSGLQKKAQLLSTFPEMGYVYKQTKRGNVRVLLYGHYRIAYEASKTQVTVLGIFHGAMDIKRYLKR